MGFSKGVWLFFKPTWAKILLAVLLNVFILVCGEYNPPTSVLSYPPGIFGSVAAFFGLSYVVIVLILPDSIFPNQAVWLIATVLVFLEIYVISCILVFLAKICKGLFSMATKLTNDHL